MAVTNPMIMSMVPGGGNPTGTNIGITAPGVSSKAANPYMGSVPGAPTGNANPYNIGMPSTAGLDLSGPFGQSFGNYLSGLLGAQGGFNPQALQAMLNQMQPGIQQGAQGIMNQFGASGAGFSDAASSALAQYYAQTGLNQQDVIANYYQQAFQNQLNAALGLAGPMEQYQQSRPTAWDVIGGLLGIGGNVVGGLAKGGLL